MSHKTITSSQGRKYYVFVIRSPSLFIPHISKNSRMGFMGRHILVRRRLKRQGDWASCLLLVDKQYFEHSDREPRLTQRIIKERRKQRDKSSRR